MSIQRMQDCKKLLQLSLVQVATNCLSVQDRYATSLATLACQAAFKSVEMYNVNGTYGKHGTMICEAMLTFAQHLSNLACQLWNFDPSPLETLCEEINTIATKLLKYKRRRRHRTPPEQEQQNGGTSGNNAKRRCRKFWVRPILQKRARHSDFNNILAGMRLYDLESYFVYLRMTPERFDDLLSRVGPEISKRHTSFREPISPGEQLALTLRYLAHGELQRTLALAFRVGPSTASHILRRTLTALWHVLGMEYLKEPQEADWSRIEEGFSRLCNFPNCVGALDGRHVAIKSTSGSGAMIRSIILTAVCDAECNFVLVDTGTSLRSSGGEIFWESKFGQAVLSNDVALPPSKELPGTITKMPHVFVAGEAHPLLPNVLRPFHEDEVLSEDRRVYNARLRRAHRVAENSLGVLAARWRIYRQPINALGETVENIVRATACLHNYLKAHDTDESNPNRQYCPPGYLDTDDGEDGLWRQQLTADDAVRGIKKLGNRRYGEMARKIRDGFATYLVFQESLNDAELNS